MNNQQNPNLKDLDKSSLLRGYKALQDNVFYKALCQTASDRASQNVQNALGEVTSLEGLLRRNSDLDETRGLMAFPQLLVATIAVLEGEVNREQQPKEENEQETPTDA